MEALVNKISFALAFIEVPHDSGKFLDKAVRVEAVDTAKYEIIKFLCNPESQYGRLEICIMFEALKAIDALELYFSLF